MRIHFANWLPVALEILADLERIGYCVTDDDVERLLASAVIVE